MALSNIVVTFPDTVSRINTGFQWTLLSPSGNIVANYYFWWYNEAAGIEGEGPVLGRMTADPLFNDPLISLGNHAASQFVKFFNSIYNQRAEFSVIRSGNAVTITYLTDDYTFSNTVAGPIEIISRNNIIAPSLIFINSDLISSNPANLCGGFNLQITTSIDFVKIITNGIEETVAATNSFNENLLRGVPYSFIFETDTGARARYPATGFLQIEQLNANDFTINEISSFGSNTIRIVDNNPSSLLKEYSINNVDWQSTTTFSGLSPQTYTLYIRDKYKSELLGCSVTKEFTISGTASPVLNKEPFIQISKANSIGFIKRETIDDLNTYKNVANSFSYEQNFAYLYCDEILLQVNDYSKIQLKSSYNNITVTLRNSENQEWNIPVNKRTNNIGKFASMDAVVQAYDENNALVYFNSGFYYDENGAQLDPYTLNGNLPEFANIGAQIEVGGVVTEIVDVVYLDSINKNAIIVPIAYPSGRPDVVIIKSEYSILKYDIYDFELFWATYGVGLYDLVIEFSDPLFQTETFQSENINIAEKHDGTVAIEYFNRNNRDIFYKYDIRHFIRVPVISIQDLIVDEIENNITDSSVRVIKSQLNEGQSFLFEEMTRSMMVKLAIALSCEFVLINGIGYSKNESFEIENIEGTNLSRIKANMLLAGYNHNNIDEYIEGGLLDDIEFDIPIIDTSELMIVKSPDNFISTGLRSS